MIKSLFIFSIVILFSGKVSSQVKQDWVQRHDGSDGSYDVVVGLVVDNSGNVTVTGTSTSSTISDFQTVKYNSEGIVQWVRGFSGGLEDRAIDIGNDNSGNVYVTGLSENQTGTYDIITIKYNSAGDSVWVKRYNGSYVFSMDQPTSLYIKGNNIYVSGFTFGGGSEIGFVTIKYNSNGDSLWVAREIEGASGRPGDIHVDDNDNVYVCGYAAGSILIKYAPDGSRSWLKNYPLEFLVKNRSIDSDNSGNLFVMGRKGTSTGNDFAVLKVNTDGDTLWLRTYNCLNNGTSRNDEPNAISVDVAGNSYITGESYLAGNYVFSTVKFDAGGVFQWERATSTPLSTDGGIDVTNDNLGNVYVTGCSNDYTTTKYNTNGDSVWSQTYEGPAAMSDIPARILVDNSGRVYVSGRSRGIGASLNFDFATIRYSQTVTNTNSEIENVSDYVLYQNYPNPFNPNTIINYQLSMFNFIKLRVYDILGNEVAMLVNETQNAGSHSVEFNGSNYPSGIYYYKIEAGSPREAGSHSEVKKMILLK